MADFLNGSIAQNIIRDFRKTSKRSLFVPNARETVQEIMQENRKQTLLCKVLKLSTFSDIKLCIDI